MQADQLRDGELRIDLVQGLAIEAEARRYRRRKTVDHGVRLADEVIHDRPTFRLLQIQCQT